MSRKAFTLIELLIVVAIIAILAAIAVPNFLEAQVRAKVSRARSDMRSFATGLESYAVDYNGYPSCNTFGVAVSSAVVGGSDSNPVLERLTTPVAYVTSIFNDSFEAKLRTGSVYTGNDSQPGLNPPSPYSAQVTVESYRPFYRLYFYHSTSRNNRATFANVTGAAPNDTIARAYVLQSAGPDLISINMGGVLANLSGSAADVNGTFTPPASPQGYAANLFYDPTNGTISFGDIYRAGGATTNGYGRFFYEAADTKK
jgi:prepilin-type N-terminal cleavage/methylation domain-containing protein